MAFQEGCSSSEGRAAAEAEAAVAAPEACLVDSEESPIDIGVAALVLQVQSQAAVSLAGLQ
eukprot:7952061-Lingulodinium_polyedra.AAC.1